MDLLRVSLAVVLLFRTRVPAIIITKDAHMTCLFLEDCVLPCSFWPTGTVVIHWYKQQIPVHSYYYNKDQYVLQNKHFSGRTNLFNSQISQGNASLVLRKVKVQDQGKYKCYTSTKKGNQETFVNLGVKAMIQFVKLEMLEQKVTCLSQNIYPAPGIFWFTDPPTEVESLQNFTRKMADTKGLFTVESSVNVTGNLSDHTYFCSVVSADGLQVWTASLRHQEDMFGEEGSGLTIPCLVHPPRQNFTLTWTFTGTEPTLIFSFDSRSRRITQPWEGKAEVDTERARQGNGSLQLLAADSSTHTGRYTCVFRGFQTRHQVQTRVNITVRATEDGEKHCRRSWWGTAASVFLFLITVSVALARCFRLRGERTFHSHPDVNNRVKSGRKVLSQFESRPNGLDHVEVETHPSAGLKTSTASDRLESSLPGATEPPAAARAPDLPKFQSSRFCCKPEQTHVNGFR